MASTKPLFSLSTGILIVFTSSSLCSLFCGDVISSEEDSSCAKVPLIGCYAALLDPLSPHLAQGDARAQYKIIPWYKKIIPWDDKDARRFSSLLVPCFTDAGCWEYEECEYDSCSPVALKLFDLHISHLVSSILHVRSTEAPNRDSAQVNLMQSLYVCTTGRFVVAHGCAEAVLKADESRFKPYELRMAARIPMHFHGSAGIYCGVGAKRFYRIILVEEYSGFSWRERLYEWSQEPQGGGDYAFSEAQGAEIRACLDEKLMYILNVYKRFEKAAASSFEFQKALNYALMRFSREWIVRVAKERA